FKVGADLSIFIGSGLGVSFGCSIFTCCTGGVTGVGEVCAGGAGGGGVAFGFSPPAIAPPTTLTRIKINRQVACSLPLRDKNAGPRTNMISSNRCKPIETMKHFFWNRFIVGSPVVHAVNSA